MKLKIVIVIVSILFIIGMSVGFYIITNEDKETIKEEIVKEEEVIEEEVIEEVKDISIVDLYSSSRPIAVMINNLNAARPYHLGLQDAYVIYEMVVEGGITRFLAVFKDQDTTKIGSIRSSRPYFLDYVLEHDAVYVHFGYSVQAKNEIKSLGIDNINFLYDTGYWREDLPISSEHTAFTSTSNIEEEINNKEYRNTTSLKTLLNYQTEDVNLDILEDSIIANNVVIPYSSYMTTSYVYDSINRVYNRFANQEAHIDYITKEQYTFKNIIVIGVEVYNAGGVYVGLNNIGSGTGYYITNGYAIPIMYYKLSREDQTVYKKLNGEELEVNDGNTFIQIQPSNQETIIS